MNAERDPENVDSDLVERCLAGDASAWDALVRRYAGLVADVARRHRLSPEDVEDAVQETFLALLRNLEGLARAKRVPAWLAGVARRCSLRRLRMRRAAPGRFSDGGAHLADEGEGAASSEDLVTEFELRTLVREALARLDPRCRNLLSMLYGASPKSYREIARILDLPIGSIGPTRARCFAALRALLPADLWDRARD